MAGEEMAKLAIDSMMLLEALTKLYELRKKVREGYTNTDTPGRSDKEVPGCQITRITTFT